MAMVEDIYIKRNLIKRITLDGTDKEERWIFIVIMIDIKIYEWILKNFSLNFDEICGI